MLPSRGSERGWDGKKSFRIALGIYALSLIIPSGFVAFAICFAAFWQYLTQTFEDESRPWLLALSWLANPALWAGMTFLRLGAKGKAAIAAELALLLALCIARGGCTMPAYYIWLMSMAYVLYAALEPPAASDGQASSAKAEPTRFLANPNLLRYITFGIPLIFGIAQIVYYRRTEPTLRPALVWPALLFAIILSLIFLKELFRSDSRID